MSATDDGPSLRLFFAAWPDAAAVARSVAAVDALQLAPEARAVPGENQHMTLAFLGYVPASALPVIRKIGGSVSLPQFDVRFDAYEYWSRPEVIVAAARFVPPALERLWRELHARLAEHHRALEPTPLRPHITLARKVAQQPVLQRMSPFDWRVETFSLVRSDTGGARSIYTVVDTWPLLDKRAKP